VTLAPLDVPHGTCLEHPVLSSRGDKVAVISTRQTANRKDERGAVCLRFYDAWTMKMLAEYSLGKAEFPSVTFSRCGTIALLTRSGDMDSTGKKSRECVAFDLSTGDEYGPNRLPEHSSIAVVRNNGLWVAVGRVPIELINMDCKAGASQSQVRFSENNKNRSVRNMMFSVSGDCLLFSKGDLVADTHAVVSDDVYVWDFKKACLFGPLKDFARLDLGVVYSSDFQIGRASCRERV